MPQGQKIGGDTRQAQHDAVAIADQNVAVRTASGRENLKMAAIERMGRIGHFETIAGTFRVVEGGINIGYRSTRWIMPICGNCFGSGYETGCCCV